MNEKNGLIKMLTVIFKQRRLIEKDFSFLMSNGRTSKFKNLELEELRKLQHTMISFDDNTLLNGLYEIMFELNVIPNLKDNLNDVLIVDFMKEKQMITTFSNELFVTNHTSKSIKIIAPFSKLPFIEKYILVKAIGDFYLERCSILN